MADERMTDIPMYLYGHGTKAAWRRHKRYGIPVCDACAHANNFETMLRAWKQGKGGSGIARCRRCGSVFPTHTCSAAPPPEW